jgi:uncharacterized membrane protein YphA (DoxX/SURF4 family)
MYKSKKIKSQEEKRKFGQIFLLLMRVTVALLLFIKGVNFIRNESILNQVFTEVDLIKKLSLLRLLIPWIHILGGFLILIGVYTRLMIMIQIPFVIGAIFVLLIEKQNAFFNTEIFFASTILVLLIFNLKFGDGFYSWRNLIQKEKEVS